MRIEKKEKGLKKKVVRTSLNKMIWMSLMGARMGLIKKIWIQKGIN